MIKRILIIMNNWNINSLFPLYINIILLIILIFLFPIKQKIKIKFLVIIPNNLEKKNEIYTKIQIKNSLFILNLLFNINFHSSNTLKFYLYPTIYI